ncbi:helix-turn-helix domain-containing protein [Saccharopolyspora erythraea]|uniref:helix-turn-helix domain-containing protein n=1 Tax=Saccharopolyspora erythraea TaxID=1836 RepID=UPI002010C967|nr:helix-turn-helix transcriptional regulator [Saccharopolyspora erythraea]
MTSTSASTPASAPTTATSAAAVHVPDEVAISSPGVAPTPGARPVSPTLRRRVLASEIKRLRLSAGLTHVDVANRLGWQQGKVSKIESAKQGVGIDAVIALAEVCDATPQQRDRLVGLAREARARGWWEGYADVLPPERKVYVGLEAEADVIRGFAAELIPDLFQTRDYAESAMGRGASAQGSTLERRLELLLQRQQHVLEDRETEFDFVLSESALHRASGVAQQLRRLSEIVARPEVRLRVLPFSAGAVPVEAPFSILEFRQNVHPDIVFVTGRVDCVYFEEAPEVAAYREALTELESLSMTREDSAAFVEEVVGRGAS